MFFIQFNQLLVGMILAVVGVAPFSRATMAQVEVSKASYSLPGCRAFLGHNNSVSPIIQGFCLGTISGVSIIEQERAIVCSPKDVLLIEMVRLVVLFVEQRPERMQEHLPVLASEALKAAWPCR